MPRLKHRLGPNTYAITDHATLRFWSKVDICSANDCWRWTAFKTVSGYGRFNLNGRIVAAHRVSAFIAGIVTQDGEVIDHTCRNRSCVNPQHLRAVPFVVNLFENSRATAFLNASKTHCSNGHPYSGKNLMVRKGGGRKCRICDLTWSNAARRIRRSRDRAIADAEVQDA